MYRHVGTALEKYDLLVLNLLHNVQVVLYWMKKQHAIENMLSVRPLIRLGGHIQGPQPFR